MEAFHEQEGTGDVRPASEPKRILYTLPGRVPVLKRYIHLTQELANPSPSLSELACSSFSVLCLLLQQLRPVLKGVLRMTALRSRRALAGQGPQN